MADAAQVAAGDGRPRARAAQAGGRDRRVLDRRPGARPQGPRPGEKKTLVGVAIEVRGRGSGRLRLAPLADASGPTLQAFVFETVAPGTVVHTDGWRSYNMFF